MYMDDIKLFEKNEKELQTLICAVKIYSQDIGMEFGIEKCAMLVTKSSKWYWWMEWNCQIKTRLELSEKRKSTNTWASWRLTSSNKLRWKKKIKKEYLRRTTKLLKTKICSKNLIKGINTWAGPLIRYSRPFLKWTREELKQMDQRTRKLITMHKALHPRDDADRLYISRKEGGRGLTCIEDSIDASIQWLEGYIEKHRGGLITSTRNDTYNSMANRMTITRKQKWEEKQLYGCFKGLITSYLGQKTRP